MASPFDAALAATDRVFDAIGGEEFEITPMLAVGAGRYAVEPDPSRSIVTRRGVRETDPVFVGASSSLERGEELGRRPGMQGQEFQVSFAVASLPWRPAAPDLLRRIATGERFAVIRVRDEGASRLHLVCGRV